MEVSGDGPDLILLHSLLTDRHAFDPIVPTLRSRWTVNQVDLPGFGGSTPVKGATIDDQVEAIAALLGSGSFEGATTSLVGNGYGAFVALGTAIRHGERFDRLLLIGCGPGFPPAGQAAFSAMATKVAEGGMEAVVDIALRRIYTEGYLASHPDEAETRRQVLLKTEVEPFIQACAALGSFDYSTEVGGVGNPTMIVTGSEDQATPPELGRQLAHLMPTASFQVLPGLAHAPHLQDPGAFLEAVGTFLALDGVEIGVSEES